jgi:hypothetical protein
MLGHEAHGPRWNLQYAMSRPQERKFKDAADMVEKITGQRVHGV